MYSVRDFSGKKLVYSIVFNIVVLAIALLVFVPFFEEIDDTHVAMIAEGVYGYREWHLIYPSFVLGKLYNLLYWLMPMVRWHTVLQYCIIFLGYVTSTYALSKHRYGVGLSMAAVLATFYEMYVSIQYTKTAAFVTAVGVLLIFECVRDAKAFDAFGKTINEKPSNQLKWERKFLVGFGCIFMIYGALLRQEAFLIACIPMFFVGCLELLRTRLFKSYVAVLAPVFAIISILILANNYVYTKDSKWTEFMTYNKARMQLTDYRHDILHYPTNGEKLEELDVSENDAMMIVTYQFGDDNVFTADYMKAIRDAFDDKPLSIQVFKNLWENIGIEIKRLTVIMPSLLLFILLLILTIISERSRSDSMAISEARMKLLAMFGIGALSTAALVYFQYSGRWSHRLVGALVIPAIYSVCYMLDSATLVVEDRGIIFGGNKKERTIGLLSLIIVVSMGFNVINCINNRKDFKDSYSMISEKEQVIKYMNQHKDQLFIIDTFTFQNSFRYDVFNAYEKGCMNNVVSCGSWFMNSPITRSVCEAFSYENPYEALLDIEGPGILLDTYFPEDKALFLTEHYNKLYNAVNVGSVGGFTQYKMEIVE